MSASGPQGAEHASNSPKTDNNPSVLQKRIARIAVVGARPPSSWSVLTVLLLALTGACQKDKEPALPKHGKDLPPPSTELVSSETQSDDKSQSPSTARLPWAKQTFSPRPGSTSEPLLEAAEEACGSGDAALHEVASVLAQIHAQTGHSATLDEANFHLHRRGAPYVMPRLWSAEASELDEAQLAEMIGKWAHTRPALGEYRCGLGAYQAEDGHFAVTAIQVDALADVQPIATQLESGKWLELEAQLLVDASEASVLVLPPEGLPRDIRSELSGGRVKARLPIETEGTWLVQLMATVSGGPRPVAQMLVTADIEPPSAPDEAPVPGEQSFDESKRDADALFEILNAAREDQGLFALKRNHRLDQVALEHCRAMLAQGRISHDSGAGDPAYRVGLAGLTPKATGENVALAGSVVRLHRALWASPSHRENMLLRRWDEVGVAVIRREEDGVLFATELFIDSD